ncbi:exonuclease domain-containing protein [Mucilaginibacter arboris]|uniref:DNA polymerase III subunit epsilon n=1 Tax=Mucilaginibacter arboris TaxID=2682090 RepID=A0A7K1T025_9SPHI|nr:exonuclease domain-containing protein [Mucilaginibacter arboris]MVN22909.1 DNA polymerase III subunit epsilon [Mucilaginibacter arboris]
MKLNLKRPLAFFDLETTGVHIGNDRIVEMSIIKMNEDGSEEVKTWRFNPGMPIPLESSLVHGIYDEHVKDEPAFKEVGAEIAAFLTNSDLAGYNSNKFDIPMLMEEFLRAEVDFDLENRHFVDVQNIFHQMEQRTLRAAYQFYCGKDIINAHSAEADTRATMEVLLAQIMKYEGVEWENKKGVKTVPVVNDVEALHQFTNLSKPVDFAGRMVFNESGEELFNFGKHKGKRVEDVFQLEPSYYAWMMQGDFPLYTKRRLEAIYKRWTAKKNQSKPQQPKPETQNRPPQPKQDQAVPENQNQNQPKPYVKPAQPGNQSQRPQQQQRPQHKPNYQQQPRKEQKPAEPINDDMLNQLKMKFGK